MRDHSPSPCHGKRFHTLQALVGNTPLLAMRCRYLGAERVIYAKAEHLNFTGSIKDRMALYILATAGCEGRLAPGDCIAEATSGNTGIAFAAIGRALGHPVTIFMPDWMSRERVLLIRSLGAEIVPVSREQGGFLGSIKLSEDLARDATGVYLPRQFANAANVEAHERTTGPEIVAQLASLGLTADAFVAGVGTGGTVMGVGRCLRAANCKVRVHPLEPAQSPTLSTGCRIGRHRIQGVSDEFIPSIVKLDQLDAVISVDDGDAILMAQKLAAVLGLAVGISSGANFLGALTVQSRLSPTAVVATVFPDDNKKYLSTALFEDEPARDGFLTPEVDLLDYNVIPRLAAAGDILFS